MDSLTVMLALVIDLGIESQTADIDLLQHSCKVGKDVAGPQACMRSAVKCPVNDAKSATPHHPYTRYCTCMHSIQWNNL